MQLLSINKNMENDKYLGLPIFVGRNKQRVFRTIKEQMRARINGWNGRLLSQTGRVVLLQSVIQSIPIYIMSCFLLPKSFVHEINMLMADFWWGDNNGKRKIHWRAWDSLCISKLDGGLGFRDFESFNLALIAKQW